MAVSDALIERYEDLRCSPCLSVVDIRNALKELSERDREILKLRYVEKLTLRNIGTEIGISANRVSQILYKTLRQLRRWIISWDGYSAATDVRDLTRTDIPYCYASIKTVGDILAMSLNDLLGLWCAGPVRVKVLIDLLAGHQLCPCFEVAQELPDMPIGSIAN
jgi:hypothetical protein